MCLISQKSFDAANNLETVLNKCDSDGDIVHNSGAIKAQGSGPEATMKNYEAWAPVLSAVE